MASATWKSFSVIYYIKLSCILFSLAFIRLIHWQLYHLMSQHLITLTFPEYTEALSYQQNVSLRL